MKRKRTSDVGQWWNILDIYDHERNYKMISFWWREKLRGMLVNDEILLEFIMLRGILEWCHFGEEKK